ncbi:nucleotide-sugar transporter-domain-containing protein [Ephemerocybe angulata]|uniref:Nucleotide-sugar transporter-domain-containing protein n=1 Tax=Ephemerocybe angulata TaxID=980116 RepID=A0A8H6IHY9_9AGAR|nr:nucleotide-sugar transporter-domain-containing protein [Tulosesus angulatus]
MDTKLKGYYIYDDLESGDAAKRPLPPKPPSIWWIPLKYLSLLTLALQNSSLSILMHYSRMPTVAASEPYSAAMAVLVSEMLKGTISLLFAFARVDSGVTPHEMAPAAFSPYRRTLRDEVSSRSRKLWHEVFSGDCWKLSIPAILYVLQNNLQYSAASNLPAATFQVTYQMKILTTAIFSVILLRKRLSSTQWFSLFCLAIGVAIIQIQAGMQHHNAELAAVASSSSPQTLTMNPLKGFSAVAAACFTSGLAGVYFEMVLKNSKTDLWVRNVQLSFFSILPALAPIVVEYRSEAADVGGGVFATLFRNFTPAAWATILVQVLGGLITAIVIKYSDNILKGFATSLSIVISFIASVALFHFQVSPTFMLGSSIVLAATYLYNTPTPFNRLVPSSPPQSTQWPPSLPNDAKMDRLEVQSTSSYPSSRASSTLTSPMASSTSLSSMAQSTPYILPRVLEGTSEDDVSPALHARTNSSNAQSRLTLI